MILLKTIFASAILLPFSAALVSNILSSTPSIHTAARTSWTALSVLMPKQGGVTFQYSATSLQHLSCIELPEERRNSAASEWSSEKNNAILGGIGGTFLFGGLGEFVSSQFAGFEGFFFFTGSLGGALGYYHLGGREARKQDLPKNGGFDAKFVADRPSRLKRILQDIPPNIRVRESPDSSSNQKRDAANVMTFIAKVHDPDYVERLQKASEEASETDRPRRLNPMLARTLVDKFSYQAALSGVSDWFDAIDGAFANQPIFALVRPPGHHACRQKGMGGCLLNGAAISAHYALSLPNCQSVGILDMDAHHGNGIAHCVQDEPRIRYVSIHEDLTSDKHYIVPQKKKPDDPRSPQADDHGPTGNCLNIPLKLKTGWNSGYKEALVEQALEFLCEDRKPDILLVAAGFDALDADSTSSFTLQPEDYSELGAILKSKFGNRIAFGLEGGYCYQNGELSQAIVEFVSPWQR